jgi:hypothetical protein
VIQKSHDVGTLKVKPYWTNTKRNFKAHKQIERTKSEVHKTSVMLSSQTKCLSQSFKNFSPKERFTKTLLLESTAEDTIQKVLPKINAISREIPTLYNSIPQP